ncbi:MAG: hypothetical protein KGZ88_20230 [Methylomicrobium sp.]|nr:hypothetical protein [Methylomicrobium sp.]
MDSISLSSIFKSVDRSLSINVLDATRSIHHFDRHRVIIDQFDNEKCAFIRLIGDCNIKLLIDMPYTFEEIKSGGYLGAPGDKSEPVLWLPALPIVRILNSDNSISKELKGKIHKVTRENNQQVSIQLSSLSDSVTDIIMWQLVSTLSEEDVISFFPIEIQNFFLLGSHACINKPADLYRHLIHGAVYDLRYSWPNNKKCFSENEAHALYTVYSGLEKATGKAIYRHFQLQLVLSIMQRQAEDGGWYHGMWTDSSECHYRLHTSGVHLLMDEYARTGCPNVKVALEKAVVFLSKTTDQLTCGAWFLHDSLELSKEAMDKGPFKWIPNTTLGKRISNMLVLNTHLDSTIAMNRYTRLTNDHQFDELIASALNSTKAVLSLKTAEWLYKPLFWAIGLTMLPTEQARRLPLPLRAIKRFASDYLIKKIPDIKAKFPRLVMPNGYIDRELSLRTWAIDYQTINLMDLARYAKAFPGELDESILDMALAFTQESGLIKRYKELPPGKQYAPGFWMEALYYRCLAKPEYKYREWLAKALLHCHDLAIGIAPSLLGTNGEAVPYNEQIKMPMVSNAEILQANLSHNQHVEYLLVNTSTERLTVTWIHPNQTALSWIDSQDNRINSETLTIEAKGWIIGKRL